MRPPVRIMPSGPSAVLAEYASLDDVISVATRLRTAPPVGVVDIVPAARTILLTVGSGIDPATLHDALIDTSMMPASAGDAPRVEIAVDYDGDDLRAVADACELSVDDVIELHTSAEYTVAFCGFMPGFSYLVGLDQRLRLPRRPTPRTRVSAGSVAIASEFCAVYPSASPGGWHLLGRTDAIMWDEHRPAPALLPPGTRVRFVAR